MRSFSNAQRISHLPATDNAQDAKLHLAEMPGKFSGRKLVGQF
jgi:hypothetical protein